MKKIRKKFDEVYLKGDRDFVTIDRRYYGGDQDWLSEEKQISKFWSDRACGVIAACNIFYYMSKPAEAEITKKDFVDQAVLLYKFITPRVYGIPTVGVMKRGVRRYAKTQGMDVISYSLVKPKDLMETTEFIKGGLTKNSPILMLTWNTKLPNLIYHWVTITGYYMESNNKHYITISNYGIRETISLDQWVQEKSIYKGLLYFQ